MSIFIIIKLMNDILKNEPDELQLIFSNKR